ncbi:MAG: TadE/TadG family type IV pilus assembly protein [Croceibacterium sp.]
MIRRNLARDDRGATIIEFALVAPVLLMLLMGLFDMGYNLYTAAVLQGAIQKAARDSTIEGATPAALDARVIGTVHQIAPNAELVFDRKNYSSFSEIGTPEDFTDINGDGTCDAGEPYEDANGNGTWDTDRGREGQGGARDAVLYTVKVSYPHAFPIGGLIGFSGEETMQTSTVLRNQPYSDQNTPPAVTRNCT